MRTTVEVNDELLRRAMQRASQDATTLSALMERALRELLGRRAAGGTYRLQWRSERGRLLPGVRLENRRALFDRTEGRG